MYILIKPQKDYIIALSRMGTIIDKTNTTIIVVDMAFFTFLLLKFILSPSLLIIISERNLFYADCSNNYNYIILFNPLFR